MNNPGSIQLKPENKDNISILYKQVDRIANNIAPYLDVDERFISQYLDENSAYTLDGIKFFKLKNCSIDKADEFYLYLNEKMEKLFTAVHTIGASVVYGIISHNGKTNLVLGVKSSNTHDIIESLVEGLLTGIELVPFEPCFSQNKYLSASSGIISAVPVIKIKDEKQKFDISTLMRSLNGKEYTVLCIAKPYSINNVQEKYRELISIRDECFAASKQNLASQENQSRTDTKTISESKSDSVGMMIGGLSEVMCGINFSKSSSESISDSISKTLGTSSTVSYDVQNGFALELMEYCNKGIERLRQGMNVGMWGMSIAYSSEDDITSMVIQSCLRGELSKPVNDILPLRNFLYSSRNLDGICIPYLDEKNMLLAPVTSSELGMICTPPCEPVPDFEIKRGKVYPMIGAPANGISLGYVSDGQRTLKNMEFSLSENDLNKHTFICGITGSGKTTTVKSILKKCEKPFMVIESAKKEYRNINIDNRNLTVYTLGKPELNCLQFNPFYIQNGINLQMHIDFLKDLFNASFSFYGPMPYILEKCLQNIYKKKGWNLTLGYHPYFVNLDDPINIFDSEYMKKKYTMIAHKYLFPTMQDLKNEVSHYIEKEMHYDSEVGGNVKTAMLARLESLCSGSKGFMLNTNTPIPISSLMEDNIVFELEGIADDSDKAFCVGLLLIFINEYRQVFKDEHATEKLDLQHLLVIEEAHRLLKNVNTEKVSENIGNPKGKAVEHFTNMIAEMRSYGQGVIIVEQIPSKLAPDVIKNSSNKIIQRTVSIDDQSIIANTIGMREDDAIYLGNLKAGYALCHKEGMNLPILIKVSSVVDNYIQDQDLFNEYKDKMFEDINFSLVKENTEEIVEYIGMQMLNSLLSQTPPVVLDTIIKCKGLLKNELIKQNIKLLFCSYKEKAFGTVIANEIMKLLSNGIYSINSIINDKLYNLLIHLLETNDMNDVNKIHDYMKKVYMQEPRGKCISIIAELIKLEYDETVDTYKSIGKYFLIEDEALFKEIEKAIKK